MRIGAHHEVYVSKIFVRDMGADCNTIIQKFNHPLVDQGLKCAFLPGPYKGLSINLVGGQTLHVTGDCDKMQN